jgi:hypothetical protein
MVGQGQETAMKYSASRLSIILALGLFFIPLIAMAQQIRKVPLFRACFPHSMLLTWCGNYNLGGY